MKRIFMQHVLECNRVYESVSTPTAFVRKTRVHRYKKYADYRYGYVRNVNVCCWNYFERNVQGGKESLPVAPLTRWKCAKNLSQNWLWSWISRTNTFPFALYSTRRESETFPTTFGKNGKRSFLIVDSDFMILHAWTSILRKLGNVL